MRGKKSFSLLQTFWIIKTLIFKFTVPVWQYSTCLWYLSYFHVFWKFDGRPHRRRWHKAYSLRLAFEKWQFRTSVGRPDVL